MKSLVISRALLFGTVAAGVLIALGALAPQVTSASDNEVIGAGYHCPTCSSPTYYINCRNIYSYCCDNIIGGYWRGRFMIFLSMALVSFNWKGS